MAEAVLEDLEFLALDLTDDLAEDNLEEFVNIEEDSTELCEERFDQVSLAELVDICSRLSDEKSNISRELFVAEKVLNFIKNAGPHPTVSSLLESIRSAFTSFYGVQLKKKQERSVRIERNFLKSDSPERADVEQKWNEIIGNCGISPDKHTHTVLQHILFHFWTVKGKTSNNPLIITTTSGATDESELQAIRYHGGWAVKRARDLVKSSCNLVLKQSNNDSTEVYVEPQKALELIKTLGTDEKVGDEYHFVINNEVIPFFVLLHDFTENFFSVSAINDQSIIDCLKNMSENKTLRDAWGKICKNDYPAAVQVSVMQRVCSMFVKSKQQIVREKMNLKPQKGSVALRQEIKKPKGNKSGKCKQKEACAADKTPEIIIKLREGFSNPDTVSHCLEEIGKSADPHKLLNNLTGKQLSKLLKALGKPAFDGKGKEKQISVLLPVIR